MSKSDVAITANSHESGRKARAAGQIAETEFDGAAHYYQAQGEIDIQPTFPEFVALGYVPLKNIKGRKRGGGNPYSKVAYGFFRAQATADRVLSITALGGRTCWVEIKNISGANKKLIKDSRHQYDQMKQAQADGAALGFYAALWAGTDSRPDEWRLHPLESVEIPLNSPDNTSVRLERETGILIPPFDDYNPLPDFLPVILAYVEKGI